MNSDQLVVSIVLIFFVSVLFVVVARLLVEYAHSKVLFALWRRHKSPGVPGDKKRSLRKIFFSVMETSADSMAAELVRQVRHIDETIKMSGIGGKEMQSAGVDIKMDICGKSLVGVFVPTLMLPYWLWFVGRASGILERENPDVVVFVGSPGFNLPLTKISMQKNIPSVYVLPPELWAFKIWNVTKSWCKHLFTRVSLVFTNFVFEKKKYQEYCRKIRGRTIVRFTGNPYVDLVRSKLNAKIAARAELLDNPNADPVICLLPGTRKGEIKRHLRVMVEAAGKIKSHYENAEFLMPCATHSLEKQIGELLAKYSEASGVAITPVSDKKRYDAMNISNLAIAKSGTVTIELASLGVPMIIMYKVSYFDWKLKEWGVIRKTADYVGLPNILAGKEIFPELIQSRATATRIGRKAIKMLQGSKKPLSMKKKLEKVVAGVNHNPRALQAMAKEIVNMLPPK